MSEHTIHVTQWDDRAVLDLRCHAKAGDPCRVVTDEDFDNPRPVDECNAIDWWEAGEPEDYIHGPLPGEPPWPVEIEWTEDGPHIVRVDIGVGGA